MEKIESLAALTEFGRTRLSDNFFMRDMLHSEVGNFYGVPNVPEDAGQAVEAGRKLCQLVLEPLRAAFGHISIRSAYRSPTLNNFCHQLYLGGSKDAWCACNEDSAGSHIWDRRDREGRLGATATIVIPAYISYYNETKDWRPLGWWMRDHLEHYAHVQFFAKLCAFNIGWREGENDQTISYLDPPLRETLTKRGAPDFEGSHEALYKHIRCLVHQN